MGRIFVVELEGRSYRCKFCKTHLALPEDLASRAFHCRRGKAYLFNNACTVAQAKSNAKQLCDNVVIMDKLEDRHENTGQLKEVTSPEITALISRLIIIPVNVTVGTLEERMMLSGMHTVGDVFCCCCGQIVGWKYEAAHEKSQKYKEGKFVLERGRIVDEIDFSSEVYIDTRPSVSDTEE
ncbi:hypothetical protein Patl1_04723 [Pistacia atlantica]|uniref:Uncharacterized protein n=1 Tax=Pistacia atlantica TaxID=434234 RepID=A0ACC1BRL4_9ROSI|nr:hypothetical protein Patl1_04723 [Pistacia atlantica]